MQYMQYQLKNHDNLKTLLKKRAKQKPDGGQQHKKERKNKPEEKGEINKQLNDLK